MKIILGGGGGSGNFGHEGRPGEVGGSSPKSLADTVNALPFWRLDKELKDYSEISASFAETLSDQEKRTLFNWSDDTWYPLFNRLLRKGYLEENPPPKVVAYSDFIKRAIQTLDKIFETKAFEFSEDTVVYRYLKHAPYSEFFKLEEGDILEDKGFVATSRGLNWSPGGLYTDVTRLRIHVKKGTPFIPIGSVSYHPYEEEILLNRGSRFRVLATTWDSTDLNGRAIYDVELLQ